ncbi:MAG: NAD(P)/FAD-dependent oxidoreductase [Candidatus Hodarchaeota archaeon]
MDQNIEEFDLVIIGGSIAGNYLTYLLSKSNLKIAVIEEHNQIGLPFQCAGIVSQKLGQLINLPEEIVLNRVNVAKIVAPSRKFIKLSGNEQPLIIDRIALDQLFYEKIRNNDNITYFLGEKFKLLKYFIENQQKLIFVETNKRVLKARILVGCDGPLSLVASSFGIRNKLLYGTQIRIKGNFDQKEAVMFFDPRWKELFGWIVSEGSNNIYRIGLSSAKNININFKIFLNMLPIISDEKIDQQGGLIPYGIMNKLAFDNALLLGDSACQVKATTGGGIVMLLIAAKYACYCIQNCFKSNKFSKRFIKKYYEKPCRASIGKQLITHYLIRQLFENFSNKDYENLFQIVKTNKIEKLISLYGDMDFPRSLLIKLLKNSKIIKFLIRLLIKKPFLVLKLIKL